MRFLTVFAVTFPVLITLGVFSGRNKDQREEMETDLEEIKYLQQRKKKIEYLAILTEDVYQPQSILRSRAIRTNAV